jgi:hypothetical protein
MFIQLKRKTMSIQQFLPTAGTIILPSDISPLHEEYRWIDTNTKVPVGSQAVCDDINFFKIEIQGKNYAIPRYYISDTDIAKDEEGNEVRILFGQSTYVTAYTSAGSTKYFTSEVAAENSNFKFSLRLGSWCEADDKIRLYGNDTVLGYHTSHGLSDASKKKLPIYHNENDEYLVGLEVEKTDRTLRDDGLAWEIAEHSGWIRERDGSLNDGGFELVSPILPLFDNTRLDAAISPVERYINGNADSSCGGHINVSRKGKTSEELLDSFKQIAPVLYALYPNRLTVNYCKAKKWDMYFRYPEKYAAFNLKPAHNVVEIRLFGRVKNTDTLKWRIKLLQLLLPTGDKERNLNQIAQQLGCTETALYKHFATQYSHTDIGKKLIQIDDLSKIYGTHRNGLSASVKTRINATMGYIVF